MIFFRGRTVSFRESVFFPEHISTSSFLSELYLWIPILKVYVIICFLTSLDLGLEIFINIACIHPINKFPWFPFSNHPSVKCRSMSQVVQLEALRHLGRIKEDFGGKSSPWKFSFFPPRTGTISKERSIQASFFRGHVSFRMVTGCGRYKV